MQESLVELLRCPVTRSKLTVSILKKGEKEFGGHLIDVIEEAILYADEDCFYPVIKGVPRLTVEAIVDFEDFLNAAMNDYKEKRINVFLKYGDIIAVAQKKNKRTKKSFTQEWNIFNYEEDKTWDANEEAMIDRFLKETDETINSLKDKVIFDAGCGNGLLNSLLAEKGITNIGMDFSNSIEKAYARNPHINAHFIQGDIQFPPVAFNYFDIVHSSGVLIATNNSELSFSCLSPTVKNGGKFSVWLYHSRRDRIHNMFNAIRKITSRLPLKFQYYLYKTTIFPVSYMIKRMKKNKQNKREMMIDILDWFSPEFRWEHSQQEAVAWFRKRGYCKVSVTTTDVFGFNIIGEKGE
jgi:SAM-dependent methyltransferase